MEEPVCGWGGELGDRRPYLILFFHVAQEFPKGRFKACPGVGHLI